MVRCASAASVCHKVSSDNAPSTSPCQLKNCPAGAVARTAAIISGSPAAAATMLMTRRRVSVGTLCLSILHHRGHRNRAPWICAFTALGCLHQRRAALVVVVFDHAIEALEALGPDDLTRV